MTAEPIVVGGENGSLVVKQSVIGWWVAFDAGEAVSGGFKTRAEAVAEARRLLAQGGGPHKLTVNWSPDQDGFRPHCGCGWTGGLHAHIHAAADEGRKHATGATS